MKNEIISELRRIRDARAQDYGYDIEAMARDLMKLDPWMKRKTVVMRNGRMVPMVAIQRRKSHRSTAGKARLAKRK